MKLNFKQKEIHERAVLAGSNYQVAETQIIEVLQEVDQSRLYKALGEKSLLRYAMKHMKLSEPVALSAIAVARKSKEIKALKAAIVEKRISVSTASRLVSTITSENASELISYAQTHSWRETEREIANRNPRAAAPDKVKMLGKGLVQITVTISEEDYAAFERACSVEAQRKSKSPSRSEVFATAVQTHLNKYDPVRKAERACQKSVRSESKPNPVRTEQNPRKPNKTGYPPKRIALTAAEKHAVHMRDRGRCTHIDQHGVRCHEDRWTDIHHIVHVNRGGTNDLENLTTLCWHHHDLVHQLSLALEGQITWLRSPQRPYLSRHLASLANPYAQTLSTLT